MGKIGRVKFGKSTLFEHLVKEINRSTKRLLIVSTNLDGLSLENHGPFAKLAKLSRYAIVLFFL